MQEAEFQMRILAKTQIGLNFLFLLRLVQLQHRQNINQKRKCRQHSLTQTKTYMKLEDFIFESITQIISGVKKAQDFASQNDATINPASLRQGKSSGDLYYDEDTFRPAQIIDFDVSVSIKEDGEVAGKAGVFVSVFKLGIEGKEGTQNLTSNRLKFSVPLMLPTQKNKTNG